MIFANMITTVIGSYPKPPYLLVPDWFNAKVGTDTKHPSTSYDKAIKGMGDGADSIFLRAAKEVIEDQSKAVNYHNNTSTQTYTHLTLKTKA